MGGRIYREGQQTWDKFVEAGIVENEVFFTDDPIITAHAIGKTKDTIKACWPIDAAVAYTLASAGPDARLTSKQMVNQHTRMATAMMSGMVGYGSITDPRQEACGHDMIEGYKVTMHDLYCSNGVICISRNKNRETDGLKQHMSQAMQDLMSFRVSRSWYSRYFQGGANKKKSYMAILFSDRMSAIRQFAETTFGTNRWSLVDTGNSPITAEFTRGECAWHDDPDKKCSHHQPEDYTGWAMVRNVHPNGNIVEYGSKDEDGRPIPAFKKVWRRGKHVRAVRMRWNHSMFENRDMSDVAPERVVLWERVSRGLGNVVEEAEVIKAINAACRRMTARNFNVVTKIGLRNSATYHWKEWDWLHKLNAWIAQTSKKNRKEHDLVNGWKWTKYNSRMSYGYEIAKFKWIPGKDNDDYDSSTDKSVTWEDGKAITTYSNPPAIKDVFKVFKIKVNTGYYGGKELPWYWKTKEEAQQFLSFNTMLAGRTGAVNSSQRVWDGATGQELLDPCDMYSIFSVDKVEKIEMDMGVDPEELMTSRECFEALMWGNPQEFDAAYELLSDTCKKYWNRPVIKNVEQNETGGQEVVAA